MVSLFVRGGIIHQTSMCKLVTVRVASLYFCCCCYCVAVDWFVVILTYLLRYKKKR